jgi:iron complex outermembrane recepter protein
MKSTLKGNSPASDMNPPDRCPGSVRPSVRLALIALSAAAGAAQAQEPVEADPLQEVVVTGERIDRYDVLPDRQTASVFGTTRSLEETPRSVSLVESPLIDLYGVRSVNDLVNIAPGTFTGNYFGIGGALDVRGERADNFFRGFRRIENRGNFPTSVAASQYIEVIKGPPPVIYGGGKVGGILNFVPKSSMNKDVTLAAPTVAASATLGTYGKRLGSVEYGAPFSIGGAPSQVYTFAQYENSDNYYHDVYTENALLQVALSTQLGDRWSLEYGGMLQQSDLNQSLGWNRVTQELIDSNGASYLAGRPGLNLDTSGDGLLQPSEVASYRLEQFAFANPFPYFALSPQQRAAYALNPATVALVPISHRTVQTEKSDFSRSDVYTAFFDVVYESGGNWSIKNQTFFDRLDHTKYSSYGFTADYDDTVFENKTTLNASFKPTDAIDLETVSGFTWRRAQGRERESRGRGFQVLDRRDISYGATGNDRFEGAHTGTGNVPYNWDQDGWHTDLGAFALIDATIAERLSMVAGARADRYEVKVHGTNTNGVYGDASDSHTAFSYNASLGYRVAGDVNLYATYATSQYVELGQGGMVGYDTIASDTWRQDSDLFEVGVKGYLYYRRIFFSAVRYEQEKSTFNTLFNSFDRYKSEGYELEARVAATDRLSFTGAATWQDTQLQNAPFFLGIPPAALGLSPAQVYGGRFTGVGSAIGFPGPVDAPSPSSLYSLNGTYTSPSGWGVSLGATHVASFHSGYAEQVLLPSYTVVRGALFFDVGKLHVLVNANNLLGEKYYTPQFLFWDSFVSPSVGRTAEVTFSYKW